jgi:predicted NAD/FAD-dependent oxidoreductase
LQCDHEKDLGQFDYVVVNCPPVQASALIAGNSRITEQIESVEMKPTWALMLALEEATEIPYDAAFINHGPLSWIARDSSKPGRKDDQQETWVIHASQTWTQQHLDASKDDVQELLINAWQQATGRDAANHRYATAHRWLYAIPDNPLGQECLWDATTGIAACGDWCGGPRVEGAFLSGMAAAGSLLRHLTVDRK